MLREKIMEENEVSGNQAGKVIDADEWYLRCNPSEMVENYNRAAESTLAREGIIDADAVQAANNAIRNRSQADIIIAKGSHIMTDDAYERAFQIQARPRSRNCQR